MTRRDRVARPDKRSNDRFSTGWLGFCPTERRPPACRKRWRITSPALDFLHVGLCAAARRGEARHALLHKLSAPAACGPNATSYLPLLSFPSKFLHFLPLPLILLLLLNLHLHHSYPCIICLCICTNSDTCYLCFCFPLIPHSTFSRNNLGRVVHPSSRPLLPLTRQR